MGKANTPQARPQLLNEVLDFVDSASGLSSKVAESGVISIYQSADGKTFNFNSATIEEVLPRTDVDGKNFIQINFKSGIKVLFTDTLVGFKPRETLGLDMSKIPKVVTTPDLLSVFEAIEESLGSDAPHNEELEVLRRVFQAILLGGELAGFDLSFERRWLSRLVPSKFQASA